MRMALALFLVLVAAPALAQKTAADCTAERLGTSIPASSIGLPVRGVTLSAPVWTDVAGDVRAYCRVGGAMAPVDTAGTARPINFRVLLPASWNRRAAQIGGGGMNGVIPNLTGGAPGQPPSPFARGLVTYGSDSGHQMAFGRGRGAAAPPGVNYGD